MHCYRDLRDDEGGDPRNGGHDQSGGLCHRSCDNGHVLPLLLELRESLVWVSDTESHILSTMFYLSWRANGMSHSVLLLR